MKQQQGRPADYRSGPTETSAANRIADDIRDRMSSLGPQAAESMQHAADAVHQTASNLQGNEAWLAHLAEQGANKLAELAQTLRTSDLQTLLGKTERFARQQPVLFAGAAMAIGFGLTRAATAATGTGPSRSSRDGANVAS
jgi:membrane-bound ClpP family serine protease